MKKTRFLVLVLVVAVMMMGAGYAWWNQTLTVNATVSTGHLDVAFANIVKAPDIYTGMDATVCGDYLNVDYKDLYPDAGGTLTFDVKNTGTMAVKLVRDNAFTIDSTDQNGRDWWIFSDDKNIDIQYVIDAAGNVVSFSKDLRDGTYTYTSANTITIDPGQTATFKIKATLNKGAGNDQECANQIGFTFKPNFIQFNDNETTR